MVQKDEIFHHKRTNHVFVGDISIVNKNSAVAALEDISQQVEVDVLVELCHINKRDSVIIARQRKQDKSRMSKLRHSRRS